MPRSYEDLADRFGDDVPRDRDDQTSIRRWIDDNIDWGDDVDRDEKLSDEVAKRIANDRGGETQEPPRDSSGRFVATPDTDGFEPADEVDSDE